MKPIRIDSKNTKMIAHRGAGRIWVENSLPAFRNAAKCSYWGIETDIHVTKDGKYIIIHDDTTERVTGQNYVVEETDFETLRNLHLLRLEGDEARLPTLEEYVTACKEGDKYCVLELKNRMPEENIKEIMDTINAMDYLDRTVFISFSHSNMLAVERLRPEQAKQFLFHQKKADEAIPKVHAHPMDVDVSYPCITPEFVAEMHALGCKVNTWTVNSEEEAASVIDAGVDFITTDTLE